MGKPVPVGREPKGSTSSRMVEGKPQKGRLASVCVSPLGKKSNMSSSDRFPLKAKGENHKYISKWKLAPVSAALASTLAAPDPKTCGCLRQMSPTKETRTLFGWCPRNKRMYLESMTLEKWGHYPCLFLLGNDRIASRLRIRSAPKPAKSPNPEGTCGRVPERSVPS